MSDPKFLVLKWDDIKSAGVRHEVNDLISIISNHRQMAGKSDNEYLVVNKAEPYADKVRALIEDFDRQKTEDIRKRAIELCDGTIQCSAAMCLADKEIQIVTHFDGEFPSSSDIDRHLRAIYEINHTYNQTLHRATHPPGSGTLKTRLMVGQAGLMLNQLQVETLNLTEKHEDKRPLEVLVTPANKRSCP